MNIPNIETLPAGTVRPLWSVMIPAYNCASYLRQTLASVLAQDPGPEQMQIEVVDDGSTKDDPESVVRETGKGRVIFHRNPKNQGVTRNFNVCIQRSRGRLVHILHGDDYVLPGFYARVQQAAEEHPGAALLATRSYYVDKKNEITGVTRQLDKLAVTSQCVEDFYYTTPIQTPSVVMRREFYEQHGGFHLELAHTADCEMWARAVGLAGGWVSPEILACYRTFPENDSGQLARTAGNLRDIERLNGIFAGRYPGFDPEQGRRRITQSAWLQMVRFYEAGDAEAELANRRFWAAHVSPVRRHRKILSLKIKRIFRRALTA
jgi:glycosyltransferase involved in cell wall biosynthesis